MYSFVEAAQYEYHVSHPDQAISQQSRFVHWTRNGSYVSTGNRLHYLV